MNKNLYRLIFNPTRGMRMAVAEIGSGQGKAQGDGQGETEPCIGKTLIAATATIALGACAFAASVYFISSRAHAQMAADSSPLQSAHMCIASHPAA